MSVSEAHKPGCEACAAGRKSEGLRGAHDALGCRWRVPLAPPVAPRAPVSASARTPPPRHSFRVPAMGRRALGWLRRLEPLEPEVDLFPVGIARGGAWQR